MCLPLPLRHLEIDWLPSDSISPCPQPSTGTTFHSTTSATPPTLSSRASATAKLVPVTTRDSPWKASVIPEGHVCTILSLRITGRSISAPTGCSTQSKVFTRSKTSPPASKKLIASTAKCGNIFRIEEPFIPHRRAHYLHHTGSMIHNIVFFLRSFAIFFSSFIHISVCLSIFR